jgi:hypothetical protein
MCVRADVREVVDGWNLAAVLAVPAPPRRVVFEMRIFPFENYATSHWDVDIPGRTIFGSLLNLVKNTPATGVFHQVQESHAASEGLCQVLSFEHRR